MCVTESGKKKKSSDGSTIFGLKHSVQIKVKPVFTLGIKVPDCEWTDHQGAIVSPLTGIQLKYIYQLYFQSISI